MARLFLRQLDREGSMGFALRGEHGGGGGGGSGLTIASWRLGNRVEPKLNAPADVPVLRNASGPINNPVVALRRLLFTAHARARIGDGRVFVASRRVHLSIDAFCLARRQETFLVDFP